MILFTTQFYDKVLYAIENNRNFEKDLAIYCIDKIKTSESVSKQSTQLKFELNSSLRQKLGTNIIFIGIMYLGNYKIVYLLNNCRLHLYKHLYQEQYYKVELRCLQELLR